MKKNKPDNELEEVTMEDLQAAVVSEQDEEQMSKVREILFGSKSRQLEHSVARLEERLKADQASMRTEFLERFHSLESYFKGEVKAVLEQILREESTRADSVKRLQQALDNTSQELADKTREINKRLDASERELREQILQARQRLTDDLMGRTHELSEFIQSEAKELRKGKTDRTKMAALLSDMATRLSELEADEG